MSSLRSLACEATLLVAPLIALQTGCLEKLDASDTGSVDTPEDTESLVDHDGDGFSTQEGDCDDGNPAINPAATDMEGDGIDQNCDGVDGTDADGDGYATDWSGGDDCDDEDAGTHPGASEVCGDGIDQDCSGADRACRFTGTYQLSEPWIAEIDGENVGDFAGYSVATAGDMNGDGYDDVLVGDPRHTNGGTIGGATYLLQGPMTGCSSLSTATAELKGTEEYQWVGSAVAGGGDINSDGFPDVVVGAYGSGASAEGAAFIFLGPVSGEEDTTIADGVVTGEQEKAYLGFAVSADGDLNGDGYADLLSGAWGDADEAGAVYVSEGPIVGEVAADAKLSGVVPSDRAGWSVAWIGDYNGDGVEDFITGAPLSDLGGTDSGSVYLFIGPTTIDTSMASADVQFIGEEPGDYAGFTVDGAGDVDGDGLADAIIGSLLNDDGGQDAGAAYLFLGSGTESGEVDMSLSDAKLVGVYDQGDGGYAAGAGDVDGNGLGDVVVAAPWDGTSATGAGAVFLFYGPVSGNRDLSTADAVFLGAAEGDLAGYSLSGAGDTDADGKSDLIIGARHIDDGTTTGKAFLVQSGMLP